ncbi:MAG: TIM barrel protein [Cyclobacteriaceae bacterium]
MNRRTTVKNILTAGGLGIIAGDLGAVSLLRNSFYQNSGPSPLYLFTKVLQWLPLEDVPKAVKDMGMEGVDLPVRKNGFFDTPDIKSRLPIIVAQSENLGLSTPILTTDMNIDRLGEMEEFLKVLAGEGIQHYRMGYLSFSSQKIKNELSKLNSTMKKAAELHEKYSVTGHYQNHAGSRVGGSVWELYHLLEGINPDHIGVQFDLRHAAVEGYRSYENIFYLISDQIKSFDLKDFVWGKPSGKEDTPINVPLGEGNVDFKLLLKHPQFKSKEIPKILHVEYDLGGAEHGNKNPSVGEKKIFSSIQKDVMVYSKTMSSP